MAARFGRADFEDGSAHEALDLGRSAEGEQLALVNERDAVAALCFVEIRGRDEDGDAVFQKSVQNAPGTILTRIIHSCLSPLRGC